MKCIQVFFILGVEGEIKTEVKDNDGLESIHETATFKRGRGVELLGRNRGQRREEKGKRVSVSGGE